MTWKRLGRREAMAAGAAALAGVAGRNVGAGSASEPATSGDESLSGGSPGADDRPPGTGEVTRVEEVERIYVADSVEDLEEPEETPALAYTREDGWVVYDG